MIAVPRYAGYTEDEVEFLKLGPYGEWVEVSLSHSEEEH